MKTDDLQKLIFEIRSALAKDPSSSFGILGHTPTTYDILSFFHGSGSGSRLLGVYCSLPFGPCGTEFKSLEKLLLDKPSHVIVASDDDKESLIGEALPYLSKEMSVLMGGYGHFAFKDPFFDQVRLDCLVPSLANGYPNTLIHLYQCLQNAARLGVTGVVAEFGMFKGGTTMMLAKVVKGLGQSWPVVGFDTFEGFPAPRSVLDMYSHPGCVFTDGNAVSNYVSPQGVEVVFGDIVLTAERLKKEDVVLAFIDTDNYSSAVAILDIIQDRVVPGGAIVFDHFTGRDRFLYTLGERFAAKRLLEDKRYFNLHDTGVFFRQQ